MKKSVLFAICFSCFLAIGCVTTNQILFDESIPPNEQSVLEIPYSLTVQKFNETEVSWNVGLWEKTWGYGKAVVNIPAGTHSLTIDYWTQMVTPNYVYSWSASGMIVSHDFLPQGKYKLVPKKQGNFLAITVEEIKS